MDVLAHNGLYYIESVGITYHYYIPFQINTNNSALVSDSLSQAKIVRPNNSAASQLATCI